MLTLILQPYSRANTENPYPILDLFPDLLMLTGLRKVVVLPTVPIFKCHLPGNFLSLNFSSNSLVLRQMIPYGPFAASGHMVQNPPCWRARGPQTSLTESNVWFYPGGGGLLPYISYIRYVPPQRVWFLSRFGLKTGIRILTIMCLNRVRFSREPRERINVFVFSTLNEK